MGGRELGLDILEKQERAINRFYIIWMIIWYIICPNLKTTLELEVRANLGGKKLKNNYSFLTAIKIYKVKRFKKDYAMEGR